MPPVLEKFPGQRSNSSIYFLSKEPFHRDTRYKSKSHKYYRCTTRTTQIQCDVSLSISKKGVVTRYGEHNHVVDEQFKDTIIFREQVRAIDLNIQLEPAEVLRRACRQNPDAGERCSAAAMRSFIRRIRHKILPRIPATVAKLGKVLSKYRPARKIYQGTVTAGGVSAVIFASRKMLAFLNTAKWLHIDGTFSVFPSQPKAGQLWIIFIREGEKGYAAVFVLCEKRTKTLYNAIWRRILQLCPDLRIKLRGVWTDFEQAAISSLRSNFPRIRIHGCWFHFDRAVTRKWDSLGMKKADKVILFLTFALPLLPANQFAAGCQEITALADPLAVGDLQALNTFTHYLRTQWVPLADVVSAHGTSVRTNNVAESFNRHSLKMLGGRHPGIWVFFCISVVPLRVV